MNRHTHERLCEIVRECYLCGEPLHFSGFHNIFIRKSSSKILGKDEEELIEEIWENSIFVLKCCWCFDGIDSPNTIRKLMREKKLFTFKARSN